MEIAACQLLCGPARFCQASARFLMWVLDRHSIHMCAESAQIRIMSTFRGWSLYERGISAAKGSENCCPDVALREGNLSGSRGGIRFGGGERVENAENRALRRRVSNWMPLLEEGAASPVAV